MPLMITGGICRKPVAEQVLVSGVAMVGMARALALIPDLAARWQVADEPTVRIPQVDWQDKGMAALAVMAIAKRHLRALGKARPSKHPQFSPALSLLIDQLRLRRLTRRYRVWAQGGYLQS
jgi:hypothetical protein